MNDSTTPAAFDSTGREDRPLSDDAVSGAQGGYSWEQFKEDLAGSTGSLPS